MLLMPLLLLPTLLLLRMAAQASQCASRRHITAEDERDEEGAYGSGGRRLRSGCITPQEVA